jgi:phosphomevalonate kinase
MPGTVLTPLKGSVFHVFPKYQEVAIRFPSRLNAMAIDPGKIAGDENVKSYSAGEIFFSIDEYLPVTVSLSTDGMSHIV